MVAFRGGTALHKLLFTTPGRYSEDIDLVQITAGAIGPILSAIRTTLDPGWGTEAEAEPGRVTMIYRFETTARPIQSMRLKVEINTREHFTVLGIQPGHFMSIALVFRPGGDRHLWDRGVAGNQIACPLSAKEGTRSL
jgi:hypothetical protein